MPLETPTPLAPTRPLQCGLTRSPAARPRLPKPPATPHPGAQNSDSTDTSAEAATHYAYMFSNILASRPRAVPAGEGPHPTAAEARETEVPADAIGARTPSTPLRPVRAFPPSVLNSEILEVAQ